MKYVKKIFQHLAARDKIRRAWTLRLFATYNNMQEHDVTSNNLLAFEWQKSAEQLSPQTEIIGKYVSDNKYANEESTSEDKQYSHRFSSLNVV